MDKSTRKNQELFADDRAMVDSKYWPRPDRRRLSRCAALASSPGARLNYGKAQQLAMEARRVPKFFAFYNGFGF
jgi:hypothetical protein